MATRKKATKVPTRPENLYTGFVVVDDTGNLYGGDRIFETEKGAKEFIRDMLEQDILVGPLFVCGLRELCASRYTVAFDLVG